MLNRMLAAVLLCTLAACSGDKPPATVSEKPVPYAVPVDAGCIGDKGRPEKPQALKQRYTAEQWAALAPGAKASAVAAQGGARMNFEDEDGAATAGCK
jgi:hypothetical protein